MVAHQASASGVHQRSCVHLLGGNPPTIYGPDFIQECPNNLNRRRTNRLSLNRKTCCKQVFSEFKCTSPYPPSPPPLRQFSRYINSTCRLMHLVSPSQRCCRSQRQSKVDLCTFSILFVRCMSMFPLGEGSKGTNRLLFIVL